MLSRLAWQFYWIGRHLERAEDTARALLAQDILTMHPQGRALADWGGLLDALGQRAAFDGGGGDAGDPRQVFRFLLRERSNPNSLLGSVSQMRDDMRAARGILPAEVWRYGSRLRDLATDPAGAAGRRRRTLEEFIRLCRAISGVITTAMLRDSGFHFWQIGRRLECADMTCRILLQEVAADGEGDDAEADSPIDSLRWAHVLNALGLTEAFRVAGEGAPVTGANVAEFIVADVRLPRSVRFCLSDARDSLQSLPANEKPLAAIARAARAAKAPRGQSAARLRRILALTAAAGDAVSAAYFAALR